MQQQKIDRIQQAWIESYAARGRCLHVGCGERPISGAVNIDPNPDRARWRDEDWDVHALPCPDGSFDVVVSSHVLQSVDDVDLAMREMARVLRPGGLMAHVIPDHRVAPLRCDPRFPFQVCRYEWRGPETFRPVLDRLAGVLAVATLENFAEFDWSFKAVATKVIRL